MIICPRKATSLAKNHTSKTLHTTDCHEASEELALGDLRVFLHSESIPVYHQ
jgi:hypothetical protein